MGAPARKSRALSSTSTLPPSRPLSAQSSRSLDSNATQPLSFEAGGIGNVLGDQRNAGSSQGDRMAYQNDRSNASSRSHGSQPNLPAEYSQLQPQHVQMAQQQWIFPQQASQPPRQHRGSSAGWMNGGLPPHQALSNDMALYAAGQPDSFEQQMQLGRPNGIQYNPASYGHSRMPSVVPSVAGSAVTMGDEMGRLDANLNNKKKKGSSTSQQNDIELRRLFEENEGRSLKDVEDEVRRQDKGPRAEKSKQIYGMLWLSQSVIRTEEGSCPRNRIFTAYSERCNDCSSGMPILNPASFGKLVRIIFPGVATRRLGVRGESKYHYVGLVLKDEQIGAGGATPQSSATLSQTNPRAGAASEDNANAPPATTDLDQSGTLRSDRPTTRQKRCISIFQDSPDDKDFLVRGKRQKLLARKLKWFRSFEQESQVVLPPIELYLTGPYDSEALRNVKSVYSGYCQRAHRSLRWCKTEEFVANQRTVMGLLTDPNTKLLNQDSLAPWIEQCDIAVYRQLARALSDIVDSILPAAVTEHLTTIRDNLCDWIRSHFEGLSPLGLESKQRAAHELVKIIDRFLEVNRSSMAAGVFLNDSTARDKLWSGLVRYVDPLKVVEDICDPAIGGHHRLLHIISQELIFLLSPSAKAMEAVSGTLFDSKRWASSQPASSVEWQAQEREFDKTDSYQSSLLSRLQRFIESLPMRFPGLEPQDAADYLDHVLMHMFCDLAKCASHGTEGGDNDGPSILINWSLFSTCLKQLLSWHTELGGFCDRGDADQGESLSTEIGGAEQQTVDDAAGSDATADMNDMVVDSSGEQAAETTSKPTRGSSAEDDDAGNESETTRRNRISLGGETMIGDDDDDYVGLDEVNEWNMKHASAGFGEPLGLGDELTHGVTA